MSNTTNDPTQVRLIQNIQTAIKILADEGQEDSPLAAYLRAVVVRYNREALSIDSVQGGAA